MLYNVETFSKVKFLCETLKLKNKLAIKFKMIGMLIILEKKGGCPMKKQLFILYFNIFLIFLGIGLVIPVLPVYLKDLGLKGSDLGMLVAAFALSQMIISPFGGTLADKLGKK